MTKTTITPLTEDHLADAAHIVSRRYGALRETAPCLPARYGETEVLMPMLVELLNAGPGVAAVVEGKLVGFLAGFPIPGFRGLPAVISPEYGNGVWLESGDPGYIWDAMYTALAPHWVADGRTVHLVVSFADDATGIETWHMLGFGKAGADAVRGLDPVVSPANDIEIRRAGAEDVEAYRRLEMNLTDHLGATPTYLAGHEPDTLSECLDLLENPGYAAWLASRGGQVIGYLLQGPVGGNARILRDAGTSSITGAYTDPAARGTGVATALLNRALTWARERGYVRCAVDFETMNPQARRFWLRHFTPITYALERHIDARAVPTRN